jgi:hypothetical protein
MPKLSEISPGTIRKPAGIVLSLCDLTGNMVKPWAEAGYQCYCVDLQHSIGRSRIVDYASGGSITYTWGDVRSWTPPTSDIEIVFAFPPCTDLAVSGARWFGQKRGYRLSDALELFDACQLAAAYNGAPYMVENPVGRLSTHCRKPDHTFNPCDYGGYLDPPGDAYTKKTCLWTGNGFMMPEPRPVEPAEGSKIHLVPPSADRPNLRAETPMGFARAVFLANRHARQRARIKSLACCREPDRGRTQRSSP